MILSAIHVIDLHRIFMVTKCVHGHSWHVAGKLSELKVCCERQAEIRLVLEICCERWPTLLIRRLNVTCKHYRALILQNYAS